MSCIALTIQIINFKRVGPIVSLRLGAILKNNQFTDKHHGEMILCRVSNSNTLNAQGQAHIVLPQSLAAVIKNYYNNIRPVTLPDNDYVFTYQTGTRIKGSEINKLLQQAWRSYCNDVAQSEDHSKEARERHANLPHLTSCHIVAIHCHQFSRQRLVRRGKGSACKAHGSPT